MISQALTNDLKQRNAHAVGVINPKSNAVVVAEVIFGKVAVQVVLAVVLVDALEAALEDREEALDCIGVRVATAILAGRMKD